MESLRRRELDDEAIANLHANKNIPRRRGRPTITLPNKSGRTSQAKHNANIGRETVQPKHRQAEYTNIEETDDPVDVIPIIPGFYLQKPTTNDLSKSLFENPKVSDDVLGVLNREAIRQSKSKITTKSKNKDTKDSYLNRKILKAVRNLNKYRESQKPNKNKLKKNKVKKMLGRMFRGIRDNMYFRGKKINTKPQKRATDDSSDAKVLGDLLKHLMNGNKKFNKYRKKKHAYYETEEQSQEGGDFLKRVVNAIQNNQGLEAIETQELEIIQRPPTMIIISTAPLHDDELEMENNAKESMEVFDDDYDGSNLNNVYQTRRKADIGGNGKSSSVSSSSESGESSYERNPGNPFTVHKNKYKQNWPYNHYMDGDHMNINPIGPQFGHMGPSGPELFFGRKWWYFNQDDFKPMSR